MPVELKVKSLEGAPLQMAGVGVPFLVEVTARGRDASQKPKIAGLDKFQVQTAGIRVYSINGDASTTYTYKVRVDSPGSFVIGPAVLSIDGTQSQSKAVSIMVGNKQVIDQAYAKKVRADTNDAFIELSVDKNQVFVGERFTCSLTFLGKKGTVKLEALEEPKIPECTIGTKTGPLTGPRTINGVHYESITWTWQLFPKAAGTIVIPASGANYQVEQEANDSLSFFSPFFKFRAERKRTYSNAATIKVEPLPETKAHVDATGIFKSFDSKINPSVAQQGEGMVLLLELEGDGDLTQIKTLQLQGMPSALKWYDSKQYVRDTLGVHGLPVKCFEYIVQGLEQGSWEIPPQTFTYFDVSTRQYATLKTVACPVKIKLNPATKKTLSSEQTTNQILSKEPDKTDDVLPLNTWGALRPSHQRTPMPWWLFFVLALLPLLKIALDIMRLFIRHRADYFKQQFAFKYARKKIQLAAREGASQRVHIIFIELFADRLKCAPSIVSQEVIEQALSTRGFSESEMRSWQDFYMHMHEKAFFALSRDRSEKDSLFNEAADWVKKLEKVL